MSVKVFIYPTPDGVEENTGIGRVVHAQYKHLPAHGVEIVSEWKQADVLALHTQQFEFPRIDVLHCHGIYWTGDIGSGIYHGWHHSINKIMAAAARRARAITVPSKWVGAVFQRNMRITPQVIGHGIDFGQWTPQESGKDPLFVIWNKNRSADVCDPTPAWELARAGVTVYTTFAPDNTPRLQNLVVIGKQSHTEMQGIVRRASAYLATTKETFGIGTVEALACGVPVVGYDYGGTSDIVQHGVNGWLVRPGDINGLLRGVEWAYAGGAELRAICQQSAQRWSWNNAMIQYKHLYECVAQPASNEGTYSVVITCYNYGLVVGRAIESVLAQTLKASEIIVVNDGSTDNSAEMIDKYSDRVTVITQQNEGVAAARTRGIRHASTEMIVCLDADDELDAKYAAAVVPKFKDYGVGIAYTGLDIIFPNGDVGRTEWPPEFHWDNIQSRVANPPANSIHSAAMFRRSMWERAGSHRQAYAPGEDTEFWTRGLSVGFTAVRATEAPLFHYHGHDGSASRTLKYEAINDWLPWMKTRRFPFGCPTEQTQYSVKSYSSPLVSVIIPVGEGHYEYIASAIESVLAQTFEEWEIVLVDDTKHGIPQNILRPYPFVRVIHSNGSGAGGARNAGLQAAKGRLSLFLDADDYLLPHTIQIMVTEYAATGMYVYGDWLIEHGDGAKVAGYAAPYVQRVWRDDGLHAVTALVETARALLVGGFDASMPAWEEGDFFTKFAIAGFCGHYVRQPLFVYRAKTGSRRDTALSNSGKLLEYLDERYKAYLNGEIEMGSCCGGNGDAVIEAKRRIGELTMAIVDIEDGFARMEFIGPQVGGMTFFGGMGRKYRGGNNPEEKYEKVHKDDVEKLAMSSYWRTVAREVVIADNLHIPEVVNAVIPKTPAGGIVAPKSAIPLLDADALKQTLKPQDDFDDITEMENNTSTPSGKRKAGRPKKIRD